MRSRALRRIWLPLWLAALLGGLLFAFSSAAGAQTPNGGQTTQSKATPTVAATATPGPEVKTLVKITVQQVKPIPKGDEFVAQVSVDAVEHLAGFDFTISYDPKRVEPVLASASSQQQNGTPAAQGTPAGGVAQKLGKSADLGKFLKSTGRQEILCSDAAVQAGGRIGVVCNLLGAPLCLGGQPGVSGSGLLASVYFKSKGGGLTTLKLARSDLALDNFAQCTVDVAGTADLPGACAPIRDAAGPDASQVGCKPDGTSGVVVEGPVAIGDTSWVRLESLGWAQVDYLQITGVVPAIQHRQQDATVELAKNSSNTLLLIGVIVAVVLALVVVGGAGYLWYRRRQSGSAV